MKICRYIDICHASCGCAMYVVGSFSLCLGSCAVRFLSVETRTNFCDAFGTYPLRLSCGGKLIWCACLSKNAQKNELCAAYCSNQTGLGVMESTLQTSIFGWAFIVISKPSYPTCFFVDNFTRSVWPFLDIWWDADVFGITFWPAREYADVHAWLIDDRYKPSKTKAWQPHYWLSEMTIWIESRDVFGTYSFFIAFNATSSSWKSHQRVPFSKAFFCPKKPIVQIILGIVQCRNSPKSWSGSVRVSTHLGGLQHGETPEAKASCFVFKKIRVDQYW